jgi:hypothetical protein
MTKANDHRLLRPSVDGADVVTDQGPRSQFKEWAGKRNGDDKLTLVPVPDGTLEMRYTAKDAETYTAPSHKFEPKPGYKGANGPCKVCGYSFYATAHVSNEQDARVQALRAKLLGQAKDTETLCAECDREIVHTKNGWKHRFRYDAENCGALTVRPAKTKAKDGLVSKPLLGLAALIALLAWFHKDATVGPGDYNLATYRPKKKEW